MDQDPSNRSNEDEQPARAVPDPAKRHPKERQLQADLDADEDYFEPTESPPARARTAQVKPPYSRRPPQQASARTPRVRPTYDRRPAQQADLPARRDPLPILLGGIIGALVVGVMIAAFLIGANSNSASSPPVSQPIPTSTPLAASSSSGSGSATDPGAKSATQAPGNGPGTFVPEEGKNHVKEGTPITYKSYPPSSGTHFGSTADYGFHDKEIPEGNLVHNMEHGAVVLYYKPGLAADVQQKLRDVYAKLPPAKYGKVKLVITPYSKLTTDFTIAAWTHIQPFAQFDYQGLLAFYQAYVDKGPEDVP